MHPTRENEARTIAHVDAERGFSGGEVQVFLLIEGLRRAGWRNVLFCPPGSESEARAKHVDIESVPISMRNDLDGAAVLALKRGFERSGAALAHLHTGRATWLGGWAARAAGIPAITTRRMDRDVARGLRTKLIYETLTRRAVAISPSVAESLKHAGVSESRLRVIWSSIDVDAFVARRARGDVRRELGVRDERVVLLALGALVRRKGLDVLLDALANMNAPRGAWELWIAGDGEERAVLERQASRLGLGEHVRFLGHRSDAAELLRASDVLVMPSRREGLGVAALEAMAAGRATVATKVGGLGQVVLDGETGLLAPPGDSVELARALDRVIADADLRARLGRAGRARAKAEFDAPRMVAAYSQLYREVLAEAAR